jgi:RNA polymerase sigma factor for flagellar operon FliA
MSQNKLTKEELDKIWAEFKLKGSEELRDQLIVNYLTLVKYVVGRVASGLPAHVDPEDMYSTGVMGLIKAVEKYDPSKNNKFETYAVLLIKGAIIDEMRSLDWVPRSVHQKSNEIIDTQQKLTQKFGREPRDEEVAKELGVPLNDYLDLLSRVRPAILIPLNADQDQDSENTHISERIPDEKTKSGYENADRNEFRKMLEGAILELPEQERMVLVLYYYENLMLKEIGQIIGVTESRVSQVHSKALLRLRGRLKNFSKEFANLF